MPEDLVVCAPELPRGSARGADWFWLVDSSVTPGEAALENLLGALDASGTLPAPALLAGKLVTPGGTPERASLPVPLAGDPDVAAAATERHLVPVRVVHRGSLLVRRDALEQAGLPPGHDLRWSARLLRHHAGLLVPASVAVRSDPCAAPGDDLLPRLQLLASDALRAAEKPWFAFRLAEDAITRVRRQSGRGRWS